MKKRKWLSLLLAVMMLVSAVPFFPVTADAADGTVEVSTWAELKKSAGLHDKLLGGEGG